MTRIWLVSVLSCFVSGVISAVVCWSMFEMWPTSVSMPVEVTTNVAAPRVTWVFMNAMSMRSPSAASAVDGVDALGHGRALAGERRLVDLERRGADDPAVGRDEVARLDVDDVARDQLLHRDLADLAAAPDLGLDDHHLLERGDARLGLALLVEPQERVEQGEEDEDDAGRELAGQEHAHDARHQEHDLHRVLVLAEEHLQARLRLRLGELVGPELRAAGLDLGVGQAGRRVHALGRERLRHRSSRATLARRPVVPAADPACSVMPHLHRPSNALERGRASPDADDRAWRAVPANVALR